MAGFKIQYEVLCGCVGGGVTNFETSLRQSPRCIENSVTHCNNPEQGSKNTGFRRWSFVVRARTALPEGFAFRRSLPYIFCHEESELNTFVDVMGYSTAFCYGALIPFCLLYLYGRQHVVMRSSRTSVATCTGQGNLKVPWLWNTCNAVWIESASFGCRPNLLDHNSTVPKHHHEIMFHQHLGDGTILFTPNSNGFGVSNSKGLGANSHVCLLPPRKPMMRDKYQTWEADDGRPSAQITQTKASQLPRSQTLLTNLGIRTCGHGHQTCPGQSNTSRNKHKKWMHPTSWSLGDNSRWTKTRGYRTHLGCIENPNSKLLEEKILFDSHCWGYSSGLFAQNIPQQRMGVYLHSTI